MRPQGVVKAGWLVGVSALVLTACASKPTLDDPDPGCRLAAIAEVVERQDRSAIPRLITLLDSDDAAVRLYSINALKQFTGQDLGYDDSDPEPQRRAAIERWVQWQASREQEGRVSSGR